MWPTAVLVRGVEEELLEERLTLENCVLHVLDLLTGHHGIYSLGG